MLLFVGIHYIFAAMYYVYILRCSDGGSYTGFSENLKERINRHANGHVPATKSRTPVVLVFYCVFQNKYKAREFGKYLKSGSGRAFMNNRFI